LRDGISIGDGVRLDRFHRPLIVGRRYSKKCSVDLRDAAVEVAVVVGRLAAEAKGLYI
jgi:hypothetical protein